MPRSLTTVLLVGLGLLLAALLTYHLTSIARHDFFVAHHFGDLIPRLRLLAWCFCAFLILLWFVLRGLPDHGGEPSTPSVRTLIAITLGGTALFAALAVATHPTRSQDIYWSLLLGKASSQYHLDPYRTAPSELSQDPWAYPVLAWKDIPMTYGPLWVGIVFLASRFTASLGVALLLTKLLFVALWALAGYLIWETAKLHHLEAPRRAKLLILFLWNPFVIQNALIDVHNDLLVMLSLLASYYFLLKRRYVASLLLLIPGVLVKYVPAVIGMVPLWYLLRAPNPVRHKLRDLGVVVLVGAAVSAALFAPFGGLRGAFAGLAAQTERIGMPDVYLPGTAALIGIFHLGYGPLHVVGVALAIVITGIYLAYDEPLLAYVLPLLALLFFATPWFQSWYGLWTLPLLMLIWPTIGIVLLSIFLIPTPELVTPAVWSLQFPAWIFYGWALTMLWRQIRMRPRAGLD